MTIEAPTFSELVERSRRKSLDTAIRISMPYGQASFSGRKEKGKADISVDLYGSRDLLPSVAKWLDEEYAEYLELHPDVKRGGAPQHFGPAVIHCHVRLEDADEWLGKFFAIVTDQSNLVPPRTLEQVAREAAEGVSTYVKTSQDERRPTVRKRALLSSVNVKEKLGKSVLRVGQDRFSQAVRDNYDHRCCFPDCEVDEPRLLIGAHILLWADGPETRGEVANGLCLCANHDRAFEAGLFVLDDECCIEAGRATDSKWFDTDIAPRIGEQIRLGRKKPSREALAAHRTRHGLD